MPFRMLFLGWLLVFSGSACVQLPEERPSPLDHSRQTNAEKPKVLCVFMDGTANDYDSNTNVRRLYELISTRRSPATLCYYDPGVGSNELPLSGMVGGAGFSKNVSQAYDFLRQNYREGDKVYMFGFSRGARQVQVLCYMLDEYGLMYPSKDTSPITRSHPRVREARHALRDYKEHVAARRNQPDLKPMNETSTCGLQRVQVEFVGIFDCVEGMANNVLRMFVKGQLKDGDYRDHKYYPYDFPKNIKRAYHAIAMDETRGMYQAVKWVHPPQPLKGQVLEQVWFPGGHGDVGGGYARSQSLAGISLNWMLEKLGPEKLTPSGLRVHEDRDTPSTDTAKFGLAGKTLSHLRANSARNHLFWFDKKSNSDKPSSQEAAFDIMETKPLIHESVMDRMKRNFSGEDLAIVESSGRYRPSQFDMTEEASAFVVRPQNGKPHQWPGQPLTFYSGAEGQSTVDFKRLSQFVTVAETRKEE